MELTCALVLLIVGSVTAGPYGYGTKGGAAAKADARALSGAYAGAGGVPLSIPSGASYSGSFSQSSSSSSASSSSSSSSFSYSGSKADGGVLPSGSGCGTGNCGGGATSAQGFAAVGSQAHSGSNAGSLAGGYSSKIPTSGYGHKYESGASNANNRPDCGSEGCQEANTNYVNGNSAGYGSQSSSAAKAAASAGVGSASGSDCGGSDCKNTPDSGKCVSGKCDPKDKCSSDNCGYTPSLQGCTSGDCGSTDHSSSIDNESNDINVNSENSKLNYGTTGSDCTNRNCGETVAPGSSPAGTNKPALDLTAPKIEPACSGSSCKLAPSGYGSFSQSSFLSSANQNGNPINSAGYGGSSKVSYSHGSSPSYSNKPAAGASCSPGTPGCILSSPLPGSNDCTSGICGSSASGPEYVDGPKSHPSYSNKNLPSVNPSSGCVPGSPGCSRSTLTGSGTGCATGNCDSYPPAPSVGGKPGYSHGTSPSSSLVNPTTLACTPGAPGCGKSSSDYGSSSKPSYSQAYSPSNPSSPGCAPGSPGCPSHSTSDSPSGYGTLQSHKPSHYQGGPVPFPGPACAPGTPGCGAGSSSSECSSGQCGPKSGPAPGYHSNFNTPGYLGGSPVPPHNNALPIEQPCAPGSPGCSPTPSDCKSGNCGGAPGPSGPGYGGSISFGKLSSQNNSPSFSTGPACSPGTPGCGLTLPNIHPAGHGTKPGYSHGGYSSPIQPKPSGPGCEPGSPDCPLPLGPSGQAGCGSGHCDEFPPLGGQSVPNKPTYTQGDFPSFIPLKPSGPACAPGAPGCASPPLKPFGCSSGNCGSLPPPPGCAPGTPGCTPPSLKPSGCTSGNCELLPPPLGCAPGTPGCAPPPLKPYGCASGNCGSLPPLSLGCVPGTPGCSGTLSGPASHNNVGPATGYGAAGIGSSVHQADYGAHGTGSYNKPLSATFGSTSGSGAYSPGPSLVSTGGSTTGAVGSHDVKDKPAYTGGFGGPAGLLKPNENDAAPTSSYSSTSTSGLTPVKPSCASGICDEQSSSSHTHIGSASGAHAVAGYGATGIGSSVHQAGYGSHGTGSYNKPLSATFGSTSGSGAYSQGPSLVTTGGSTTGADGSHDIKDKPAYTGGFGGPAGLLKPNENDAAPTSSYSSTSTSGLTPVKPSCASGICDEQSSSSHTHIGSASGAHAVAGYGATGIGSSVHQAGYGSHGTGSYNKPLSATFGSTSGSGAYSQGPSLVTTGGSTTGANGSHDIKDKPAYTGGFGGPAGLLKPNVYDAALTSSYSSTPTSGLTPVKPSCASGICDAQSSSSHTHIESASGAHAVTGASASANAVIYSGGFGGPPGFLKPYDDGKIDLKGLPGKQQSGSSHGLNQEGEGSGAHSTYSSGGSQANAGAVVQANADHLHGGSNGGYNHGHGAGGCGGGCGGGGSGSVGYGGSLALSKAGALDGSSEGLATAGAVAKSITSATSGARAFGSSYASSSASAHAGASVKGGYERR